MQIIVEIEMHIHVSIVKNIPIVKHIPRLWNIKNQNISIVFNQSYVNNSIHKDIKSVFKP